VSGRERGRERGREKGRESGGKSGRESGHAKASGGVWVASLFIPKLWAQRVRVVFEGGGGSGGGVGLGAGEFFLGGPSWVGVAKSPARS